MIGYGEIKNASYINVLLIGSLGTQLPPLFKHHSDFFFIVRFNLSNHREKWQLRVMIPPSLVRSMTFERKNKISDYRLTYMTATFL